MPLPPRQIAVLRYLGDHKGATTGNVIRDLNLNKTAVRTALAGLVDAALVSPDHTTWPTSYAVTEPGGAVLAAAPAEREPS